MAILLIEDEATPQLAPITLTRPSFAIACGGTRLIDEVRKLDPHIYTSVRPHLQTIVPLDYPDTNVWPGQIDEPCLCINARLVPSSANIQRLRELQATPPAVVESPSPVVHLPPDNRCELNEGPASATQPSDWDLLQYPHEVLWHHLRTIGPNVEAMVEQGAFKEVAPGVFCGADVDVPSAIDFDTTRGPILIRAGTKLGAFSVLRGPLLIDSDATVLPQSHLKGGTYIGPRCKVGGEIAASIMEPLANKQHHGYLGHAYIGSWVNLGAGTCNSDLKNTYGQINVQYEGASVATGMQFLGCVIGDYAKTAINTSIYTGKRIGVASMLYGTVTESVPSFVNHAGRESAVTPEVAITMQERMFARRDVPHRPCDAELLRAVYELTAQQRQGLPTGPPQL